MCAYIYICIYSNKCFHICLHTNMHICIYAAVCIYTYACIYSNKYFHIFIYANMQACQCMHIYLYIQVHIFIFTDMQICTHGSVGTYVCIYVCIYICSHTCVEICPVFYRKRILLSPLFLLSVPLTPFRSLTFLFKCHHTQACFFSPQLQYYQKLWTF